MCKDDVFFLRFLSRFIIVTFWPELLPFVCSSMETALKGRAPERRLTSTGAVPIALTRQCAICGAFNAERNFGAMVRTLSRIFSTLQKDFGLAKLT